MKDFLINKDLSIAQKAAHKIVSSCELLGLSKMKKTLIEIEKMASQKNNYSKIVEKNKLINLYIEKISPQIEKTIAEN